MPSTFPALLAVKLVGSVLTLADAPPNFDPAPACKAAVAINQSIDLAVSQDYQSCINDEKSARDELAQTWSKYDAQERRRCIGQTEVGGFPSYVEVLECLLVTVNVGDASVGGHQ
jgi:LAS superfamily LD-carboxypeptidase LdcB